MSVTEDTAGAGGLTCDTSRVCMFLLSANKGWHVAEAPTFKDALQAVLDLGVLLLN